MTLCRSCPSPSALECQDCSAPYCDKCFSSPAHQGHGLKRTAIDWRGMAVILFCNITVGMSFGLPLATMKAYIETDGVGPGSGLGMSSTWYALTVSAFNIGDIIGSMVMGVVNTKYSIKITFTISSLLGVVGGVGYALAGVGPCPTFFAPLGRLFTGLSSGGANSMIRTFIGVTVPADKIGPIMSLVGFITTLFMAISPGFDVLISLLPEMMVMGLYVDQYRSVGYVLTILSASGVFIIHYGLNRPTGQKPSVGWWDYNQVSPMLMWSLLGAFFVSSFGYTALETLTTPIMMDHLGYDESQSSIIYVVGGAIAAVFFGALYVMTSRGWLNQKAQCLVALIILASGYVIMSDHWQVGHDVCQNWSCSYSLASCPTVNVSQAACIMAAATQDTGCVWNMAQCDDCPPVCRNPTYYISPAQLWIGFTMINWGFIACRVLSATLFTKFLKDSPSQAMMQSILTAMGGTARVIGPLMAVSVYEMTEFHHTWFVMGCLFVVTLMPVIPYLMNWTSSSWQRIFPLTIALGPSSPLLQNVVVAKSLSQ